jgi:hypothetical protein
MWNLHRALSKLIRDTNYLPSAVEIASSSLPGSWEGNYAISLTDEVFAASEE